MELTEKQKERLESLLRGVEDEELRKKKEKDFRRAIFKDK